MKKMSEIFSNKILFNKKAARGQVAIEFIFILLIIIVYIFTVTKPLIDSSISAVDDIEKIARIKNETEKLASNINEISLLGNGSKRTITLFIPTKSQILCDHNLIGFNAEINDGNINPSVGICENNICKYNSNIYSNVKINCPQDFFPSGQYQLAIEKFDNNIILSVS